MKFAEYINEGTLISDLTKLEKALPKEFKMEDFLYLQKSLGMGYGGNWGNIIEPLATKAGVLKKVIISKAGYVNLGVWRDENGYGNYGTPRKVYQEKYDELVNDENWEDLINANVDFADFQDKEEKKIKSIASIIEKGFGKVLAAKIIVKSSSTNAITDGNGVSYKWFESRMKKLWHSERDIYKLSYKAYKHGDTDNVELYNWIKNLKTN